MNVIRINYNIILIKISSLDDNFCIENLVGVDILLHRNRGNSQQLKAMSSHIKVFCRQLLILVTRVHVSHVLSRLLERVNNQSQLTLKKVSWKG